MKYRRLTNEELKEVELAFTRFLASNTVTADDWVKIKTSDVEKAEGLIEMFSDIVFEETLKKLEYLDFKTPTDLKVFHCQADKIIMRGMMVDGSSDVDFTQQQNPLAIMQTLQRANAKINIYTAEKVYSKAREQELFDMMESGCLISDGTLFKTLAELR